MSTCRTYCDGERVAHRWCLSRRDNRHPKGFRRCFQRERWCGIEGYGVWDAYGERCAPWKWPAGVCTGDTP